MRAVGDHLTRYSDDQPTACGHKHITANIPAISIMPCCKDTNLTLTVKNPYHLFTKECFEVFLLALIQNVHCTNMAELLANKSSERNYNLYVYVILTGN